MTELKLIERTPAPPEDPDWQKSAPRWLLVSAIAICLVGLGALGSMVMAGKTEREQRVEDALKDTPTRYQARLSERVAILETQTQNLSVAVTELNAKLDTQTAATNELTIQMRLLTAEIKKGHTR